MSVTNTVLDNLESLRLLKTPNVATVLKLGALGLGGALTSLAATSAVMHKGETHRTIEHKPFVYKASKVLLGMLGIEPYMWQEVHRRHHRFTDIPGKDPHTPIGKGRFGVLKNSFRNVSQYKAEITKIKSEVADGTFVSMSGKPLEKGRLDVKSKWWKPGYGILAGVGAYALIGAGIDSNAVLGAATMLATGQAYKMGGDLVNSLGHAGKHPLKALFTGWITPFKKGEAPLPYASNSYAASILTTGEGSQGWHHNADVHPGNEDYWFSDPGASTIKRTLQDPAGALLHGAVKLGLATVPPLEERVLQYGIPEPIWPEDLPPNEVPYGVKIDVLV